MRGAVNGLDIAEQVALELSGTLAAAVADIIGRGPTRAADLAEATLHIHAIQHMIMSQSAARAHPDLYRLLGEEDPS
jgi:hypothetical protein